MWESERTKHYGWKLLIILIIARSWSKPLKQLSNCSLPATECTSFPVTSCFRNFLWPPLTATWQLGAHSCVTPSNQNLQRGNVKLKKVGPLIFFWSQQPWFTLQMIGWKIVIWYWHFPWPFSLPDLWVRYAKQGASKHYLANSQKSFRKKLKTVSHKQKKAHYNQIQPW